MLWISTQVVCLQRCLVLTWLVALETVAISAHSVNTIRPCSILCHSMQSHKHRVQVCFAVTCHLHFWQNGWDLLRATAVTQGWNRYHNRSEQRKKHATDVSGYKPSQQPPFTSCASLSQLAEESDCTRNVENHYKRRTVCLMWKTTVREGLYA